MLDSLNEMFTGRIPRLGLRLARLILLPIIIIVALFTMEHSDKLLNPIQAIVAGCMVGLMVDGIYNEVGRTWQVVIMDLTFGFLSWMSLLAWVWVMPKLPTEIVSFIDNPVAFAVIAIAFSRLTIMAEDVEHAREEGIEAGEAGWVSEVQRLEDRLDHIGDPVTRRLTAPDDGDSWNGDGRQPHG